MPNISISEQQYDKLISNPAALITYLHYIRHDGFTSAKDISNACGIKLGIIKDRIQFLTMKGFLPLGEQGEIPDSDSNSESRQKFDFSGQSFHPIITY